METKDKNRAGRQRRTPQEERRQRAAATEEPRKRKTAPRQETSAGRRREEAPAAKPARQRQEKNGADRQRQSSASRRQPQNSVRRSARPEDMPISVPQGTGPRKSAPQPSAEEMAALRRQQHRQRPVQSQNVEKKNALQDFISGVRRNKTPEDMAEKSARRRKDRAAQKQRKQKQNLRYETPAVIYTEPQVFNRDRLLIQLLTVTAVVAAVVLGMSVFFKVKTVTVSGADKYSDYNVRVAAGIAEGDNLLTFSKPKAAAKIQAELPYVEKVRIGIKLPDTVIIYIEEADVAYAIEAREGGWWLITSDGKVIEQLEANRHSNYTQVLGVVLENPQVGNAAVAANDVIQETLASGEPVPLSVTGEQRLSAALQILKALEANDIVGEAASVDVTSLDDVMLWYGSRYEVMLGDTSRMEYKIACMNDAILQMSDYQSGILDISFTNWEDQVGYTPFG